MCETCLFDPETKNWLYFLPPGEHLGQPGLVERAVDHLSKPMIKVFLLRRWEIAALSRWTGVMSCLKRMSVGIMMNLVLPVALAGLARGVGASQEKLAAEVKKNAAKVAAGQEVDDHRVKNMSRALKVSSHFGSAVRHWQTGITLRHRWWTNCIGRCLEIVADDARRTWETSSTHTRVSSGRPQASCTRC